MVAIRRCEPFVLAMGSTFDPAMTSELAAAFLQTGVTVALVILCGFLYRQYRKPYFAYWALAWLLYALRLGAIITFLGTDDRVWLYWHQVGTGWTALAFLWAALVFSEQIQWRPAYFALLLFPPAWSYIAIYRLDNFLLAAGPAVLFLSIASFWTGWVLLRHHRQVGSRGAALLAGALFLWAAHHLDYPFLRARGAWNPWGYYLDITFELAMGLGILLLVLDDLHRGVRALSTLSADLQPGNTQHDVLGTVLERPLTLPAVKGSAVYLLQDGVQFVRGAGVCVAWATAPPDGAVEAAVHRAVATGKPEIARDRPGPASTHAYVAALPLRVGHEVTGAFVIVGDARDPFAALDTRFLVALGQQVGAALANADLYRSLEARTVELERLATRMVRQHEAERGRLSRELHDETAQLFSAVKLQLGVVQESAPPEMAGRLGRALTLIDSGISSIRRVTRDLRPSLLDDLGLLPALRALVDEFGERSSLLTRLSAPESLPPLSPETELALFRALQEGLSNVARHSGARSVTVRVAVTGTRISLTVQDDGRGLPPGHSLGHFEHAGRFGLAGMRERIASLGGTLTVNGSEGEGVGLVVEVPLGAESES